MSKKITEIYNEDQHRRRTETGVQLIWCLLSVASESSVRSGAETWRVEWAKWSKVRHLPVSSSLESASVTCVSAGVRPTDMDVRHSFASGPLFLRYITQSNTGERNVSILRLIYITNHFAYANFRATSISKFTLVAINWLLLHDNVQIRQRERESWKGCAKAYEEWLFASDDRH